MIRGEIVQRAGARKARAAATAARRALHEANAPRRAAISTLIGASEERKRREGHLASALAARDAVKADIAAAKAHLAQLKADDLPAAERDVEAARARVEALASDLDHARRVMEAEQVLAETEPTK